MRRFAFEIIRRRLVRVLNFTGGLYSQKNVNEYVDGGRAEGLVCADTGARTPIGVSGNSKIFFAHVPVLLLKNYFSDISYHVPAMCELFH